MHVSSLHKLGHFVQARGRGSISLPPHHFLLANQTSPFRPSPHISSSPDMGDHSTSSHLKVLFDVALQDYETQTGIALAKHPLAERLQECDSVESITAILYEQTQAFNDFRGKEKVFKLLKNAVSVLYKLSACAKLGEVIGVVHLKALYGEFHTSDPRSIEVFACRCNTLWTRCPALRICFSFVPSHASL